MTSALSPPSRLAMALLDEARPFFKPGGAAPVP
jgi:hypothetical protein